MKRGAWGEKEGRGDGGGSSSGGSSGKLFLRACSEDVRVVSLIVLQPVAEVVSLFNPPSGFLELKPDAGRDEESLQKTFCNLQS